MISLSYLMHMRRGALETRSLVIAIVFSLTNYRQQRAPVPSDSPHPLPMLDEPYLLSYDSGSVQVLTESGRTSVDYCQMPTTCD